MAAIAVLIDLETARLINRVFPPRNPNRMRALAIKRLQNETPEMARAA